MNNLGIFNTLVGSRNLITGYKQGLGRATLKLFLQNNCGPVLCIDKSFEENFEEKLELDKDLTRDKLLIKTHNTYDDTIESSLSEFVDKHGSIDNVINAAGVGLNFLLYTKNNKAEYSVRHAYDLMKHNTVGTFNVIRLASKYMVEGNLARQDEQLRNKCIINVGCMSAYSPIVGQTFYAGTKASIESMTLCTARELAPFNIRCNTIHVGYFDTDLLNASGQKVIDYANKNGLCPNRIGQPEEFAHFVQKVVENQMVNGVCIKLDTGTRIGHMF